MLINVWESDVFLLSVLHVNCMILCVQEKHASQNMNFHFQVPCLAKTTRRIDTHYTWGCTLENLTSMVVGETVNANYQGSLLVCIWEVSYALSVSFSNYFVTVISVNVTYVCVMNRKKNSRLYCNVYRPSLKLNTSHTSAFYMFTYIVSYCKYQIYLDF